MDTSTQSPSFTVSLRGYDREEVDDYLDSLAEALGQVDNATEHNRRLQSHIHRLNARVKELEDRIRADVPRTGGTLAERIGLLLREAEDAATDTISRAQDRAAEIVAEAEGRLAAAERQLLEAAGKAEAESRRIEADARTEAANIIGEADGRAAARTKQIEQWVEQVISHTRAEEARLLDEQRRIRLDAQAEFEAIDQHRAAAVDVLSRLHEAVGGALGVVSSEQPAVEADTSVEAQAETPMVEPTEDPVEPEMVEGMEASDPITGSCDHVAGADEDEDRYESKLEAWVTGSHEAI